jgi:predicted nucleic acid-binding protein
VSPRTVLADTSFFIAVETGRPLRADVPQRYQVSTITVGELRAGVLSAGDERSRAARLRTLTKALETEPIPVDDQVAVAWAELRSDLRAAGRRMPVNASWIAATAIAHGLPVVTQDDDYDGTPGLEVIKL